jgi:hypothetical protein
MKGSKSGSYADVGAGADDAEKEEVLRRRVRSALNVFEVQGAGCGEMRFAGSVRKGQTEQKLLISVVFGRYDYMCMII